MTTLSRYILFFLFFCLASCQTDIEIKMKPTPPKLVLNASVGTEQELSAHLSESWFITEKPTNEVPDGASIRVFLNGEDRGLMQLIAAAPDSLHIPKGQYRLPDCRLQIGDHLRLEAEANGLEPVAGEVIVPERTEIITLDTLSVGNSNMKDLQVYVGFNDRATEKNYYRLVVRKETEYWKGDSLITTVYYGQSSEKLNFEYIGDYIYNTVEGIFWERFYITHTDPVFRPQSNNNLPDKLEVFSCWGCFADELINGKTYVLKGEINYPSYSFKGDTVTSIVHYDIQLFSITDAYYQYMKAVWQYALNEFDLGPLKEPYSAYSNVEGGYGVVSAYQIASRRITMPFGSNSPYWNPFMEPANNYP